MSFVHLHTHSEYSLLDGQGRIKKLVAEAKRLGQPALALTDHGVMHGAIEFFRACKDAEIRPIIGVESYQTVWGRPMGGRDPEFDRENYHLLLLAKNMAGYRNLLKIASHSQLNGYYYRPRIDHDFLGKHTEGIVATTGCLGAELPQLLNQGKEKEAYDRLGWYIETFGKENFFIELQEHAIDELRPVNKILVPWAEKFGIGLLATNDVHYVRESDAMPHEVLLCVQTGSTLNDEKRMRMSDQSYFLKSREQMEATFRPYLDLPASAFDNSLLIAEMCSVDLEDKNYHLPDFDVPAGHTYETYLRQLTEAGLVRLYGERAQNDDVQERKERELRVIHQMGFDVYFLIVADLCQFAKSRNIWWNVRGSGAGSLVAYCTGITGIDPLKNNLIFERFLNPARVSMPDFDLDFPDDQREEMIRYTVQKYGADQVAQIATMNRMKARAAIRDVGRAKGVELAKVDRIAKLIPAIPGKPVTIQDVLTEGHEFYNPELVDLVKKDEGVKDLVETSMKLEGVARNSGIHAAAVIVADRDLTHYTPLMRASKGSITKAVTQYEFPILESIGLLKVDFLGLSTLTVMREAGRLIKERHGIEYTLATIPFEGEVAVEAFKLLSSGEVSGVFQVESQGMRRVLTEMRPTLFEHIVATISLYRPGPLEYIPQFIRRLHGKEPVEFKHTTLEPIVGETYGILVYQEQIIQVLCQLAGYSPGEADLVRRAISKKKASDIEKHKKIFVEGCKKNAIPVEAAEAIYGDIEFFARYGFNKCLPGHTEVIDAATGRLVRLEDLYTGEATLTETVTCDTTQLTLQAGPVAAVMNNGVKPVYRLTTALGRQIEATANHPFYTFAGWRLLGELQVGDQVAVPRRLPVQGSAVWPDHEVIALGHLLAAGNQATCVSDAKPVEQERPPGVVTWAGELGLRDQVAQLQEIPAAAFELNNRQLGLLFSRMWEGAGYVNLASRSLSYVTASRRLAQQVQHLLLRLGVISRVREVVSPAPTGQIGYQVVVTGADNLAAFVQQIAGHLVSQQRRAQLAKLMFAAPQNATEQEGDPAVVKALMRRAKAEQGVTLQTPQRLADYFEQTELQRTIDSDIYWDRITSIEYVGEKQTYDLEAPGAHNFVANDILVHNSHAADYAVICVQTAYLKAHYPVEYMAALLLVERDKTEKVVNFISEARRMGIEVLPPDVNYSGLDFEIQQRPPEEPVRAHRDPSLTYNFPVPPGSAIRFGMAAVKNVGEAPVEVILKARTSGGPFASLEDFCDRVDLRQVGKRPLECLIKVGAFDRFGKRSQLLAVLDQMVDKSTQVHNDRASGQLSIFDLFGGAAAGVTAIPLPEIDEAKGKERLQWEKELLGVYANSHPLQTMSIDWRRAATCSCAELNEEYDGKGVALAGMISSVRTINTKKGDQMAFVQIEDMAGQCEVVVFPRTYAEVKEKLIPDTVYLFKGKAQTREGQTSLLLETVQSYVELPKAVDEPANAGADGLQKLLFNGMPTFNGMRLQEEPLVYKNGVHSNPADDEESALESALGAGEEDGDDADAGTAPEQLAAVGQVRVSAPQPATEPTIRAKNGRLMTADEINAQLSAAEELPYELLPEKPLARAYEAKPPAQSAPQPAAPTKLPNAAQPLTRRQPTAQTESTGSDPAVQSAPQLAASSDHELTQPAVQESPTPTPPVVERNGRNASRNGPNNGGHAGRQLHITFRRSGDLDRDKYRLKEIYDHVRDPRGRDRFFIRLELGGQIHELAFPNDPCTISERLVQELKKRFRVEVTVDGR